MSYSWRDSNIASRMYNDLVRSQVHVWRDQVDGDPIEDFQKEFLSAIDECDYFLLLDSPNYRTKSKWCHVELERCLENQKKRNAPKLIVCLLEPDGDWRRLYNSTKEEELFSTINNLKYHNFHFEGYDNNNIYQSSISSICEVLGLSFVPWNEMPSHQDLMDELFYGQSFEINKDDSSCVIEEYKIILHKIRNKRNNINPHFKMWIEDCKELQLKLFFPEWTYSIWLANSEKPEDIIESEKVLQELMLRYPAEPRICRCLGCISALRQKYQEAIDYLQKAYELIILKENSHQRKHCEFEILYNLSQSYINIKSYVKASSILEACFEIMQQEDILNIQLIKNIEYTNTMLNIDAEVRIQFLNECIKKYPLEAELYSLLGFCLLEKGYESAINAFKKSYILQPTAERAFHLLCQLSRNNRYDDCQSFVIDVFNSDSISQEDDYWKGAIAYFINKNTDTAKYYFNKCNKEQYIWYDDI